MPNFDRFILRLLLRLKNDESLMAVKYELPDEMGHRALSDLLTHYDEIFNDAKRVSFFHAICERFTKCGIEFVKDELFLLFCRICINSFSILNSDLNTIGTALYIQASVFDHSCTPNTSTIFDGVSLEVRAIKTIEPNEKISINYVDIKLPRAERKSKLLEQYYFQCNCPRCDIHSETEECTDEELNQVKSLDTQLDDAIYAQNYEYAYELGKQTLPLYKRIYGFHHPDLSVQLMRLFKLRVYIGNIHRNDQEFKNLFEEVEKSVLLTHGKHHTLYKMLFDLLNYQ